MDVPFTRDEILRGGLRLVVGQHRRRRERAHASGVGHGIALPDAFMILGAFLVVVEMRGKNTIG